MLVSARLLPTSVTRPLPAAGADEPQDRFDPTPPTVDLAAAARALASGRVPTVDNPSIWKHDAGSHGTEMVWTRAGLTLVGGTPFLQRLSSTGEVAAQGEEGVSYGGDPSARVDGGVYVSRTSELQAFSSSGHLLWSKKISPAESLFTGTASGPEGNCYVFDHDTLYAVSPEGEELWTKPLQAAWHGRPPVVGPDGTVHMATKDGEVYAFTPEGKEKWRFSDLKGGGNGFSPVKTDLAVGPDGTVSFGADKLYVLNGATGQVRWTQALGNKRGFEHYDTPAIDCNGNVYASGGEERDTVMAFDREGRPLWSHQLGPTLHLTARPEGGVIMGIRGGALMCLSDQGVHEWTFQDRNTFAKPIFGEDGLIYTSSYGRYVYGLQTPAEWAQKQTQGPPRSPQVFDTEGRIIVGGVQVRKRRSPEASASQGGILAGEA